MIPTSSRSAHLSARHALTSAPTAVLRVLVAKSSGFLVQMLVPLVLLLLDLLEGFDAAECSLLTTCSRLGSCNVIT